MKLKQAKGNTWYLEDWMIIPLYMVDDCHCILLDCGDISQREALERVLHSHGLTPIGILATHAHTDHAGNMGYLQKKYSIPVALTLAEVALCCSIDNIKGYYYMLSKGYCLNDVRLINMVIRPDRIIFPEEEKVTFCGVDFDIIPTPGHSPGHVSIRTPDGVLCLGDALLTGEDLESARLPYHFCLQDAVATLHKLKDIPADCYLAAHKGFCTDLGDIPQRNIRLIEDCAQRLKEALGGEVDLGEFNRIGTQCFRLLGSNHKAVALYERNLRSSLEYMLDTHLIAAVARDGVFYYVPADSGKHN